MKDTFGQKLQKWREGAGVSQAELARRMNVSRNYISNLERDFSPTAKGGRPQPSIETCDKIARALGIKVAEVRLAAGYATPGEVVKTEPDDANTAEVMRQALLLPSKERIRVARSLFQFEGIPIKEGDTITLIEELPKEEDAEDISRS